MTGDAPRDRVPARLGAGLGLLWLVAGIGLWVWGGPLHPLLGVSALVTPLAVIALGARRGPPAAPRPGPPPELADRMAEVLRIQRRTEAVLNRLASTEPRPLPRVETAPRHDPAPEIAPDAPRGTPVGAEPLGPAEVVQALNFPQDENDRAGFRALRRALRDPTLGPLVRAAQDVLTLLAENGIYMDDLTPDPVDPALWRRYGAGLRGPGIEDLASLRDPACLDKAAQRMRADPIFHDTAQHFLRRFDTAMTGFLAEAPDDALRALTETRTARAFMLLGRVSGSLSGGGRPDA